MKEKIEELVDKKMEELLQKEDLSVEELAFLVLQFDRKETKKFQEEHKELMVDLINIM